MKIANLFRRGTPEDRLRDWSAIRERGFWRYSILRSLVYFVSVGFVTLYPFPNSIQQLIFGVMLQLLFVVALVILDFMSWKYAEKQWFGWQQKQTEAEQAASSNGDKPSN